VLWSLVKSVPAASAGGERPRCDEREEWVVEVYPATMVERTGGAESALPASAVVVSRERCEDLASVQATGG